MVAAAKRPSQRKVKKAPTSKSVRSSKKVVLATKKTSSSSKNETLRRQPKCSDAVTKKKTPCAPNKKRKTPVGKTKNKVTKTTKTETKNKKTKKTKKATFNNKTKSSPLKRKASASSSPAKKKKARTAITTKKAASSSSASAGVTSKNKEDVAPPPPPSPTPEEIEREAARKRRAAAEVWYQRGLKLSSRPTSEYFTIEVDGRRYTKRECYLEALYADWDYSDAWYRLGSTMPYNFATRRCLPLLYPSSSSSVLLTKNEEQGGENDDGGSDSSSSSSSGDDSNETPPPLYTSTTPKKKSAAAGGGKNRRSSNITAKRKRTASSANQKKKNNNNNKSNDGDDNNNNGFRKIRLPVGGSSPAPQPPEETVRFNGRKFTQQDCFLQALRCDYNNWWAWCGLAITLGEYGTAPDFARSGQPTVTIRTSTAYRDFNQEYNQQMCMYECTRCSKPLSQSWYALANALRPEPAHSYEKPQVVWEGKVYSRIHVHVLAARYAPENAWVWYYLALLFRKVQPPSGPALIPAAGAGAPHPDDDGASSAPTTTAKQKAAAAAASVATQNLQKGRSRVRYYTDLDFTDKDTAAIVNNNNKSSTTLVSISGLLPVQQAQLVHQQNEVASSSSTAAGAGIASSPPYAKTTHGPLGGFRIGAHIYRQKDCILECLRRDPKHSGAWTLLGDLLDPKSNETLLAAAARNLYSAKFVPNDGGVVGGAPAAPPPPPPPPPLSSSSAVAGGDGGGAQSVVSSSRATKNHDHRDVGVTVDADVAVPHVKRQQQQTTATARQQQQQDQTKSIFSSAAFAAAPPPLSPSAAPPIPSAIALVDQQQQQQQQQTSPAAISSSSSSSVIRYKVGRRIFSQRQCYVEALIQDPENSHAWFSFGNIMGKSDFFLFRRRRFAKIDCFIEALRWSPNKFEAWNNLGVLLYALTVLSREQSLALHQENYSLASPFVAIPNYSSSTMVTQESFTEAAALVNGHMYTARECMMQSANLCKAHSEVWCNLGRVMAVVMSDGDDHHHHLRDANNTDDDNATTNSVKNNSVIVRGRRYIGPLGLYQNALKVNGRNVRAWNDVGALLSATTTSETDQQQQQSLSSDSFFLYGRHHHHANGCYNYYDADDFSRERCLVEALEASFTTPTGGEVAMAHAQWNSLGESLSHHRRRQRQQDDDNVDDGGGGDYGGDATKKNQQWHEQRRIRVGRSFTHPPGGVVHRNPHMLQQLAGSAKSWKKMFLMGEVGVDLGEHHHHGRHDDGGGDDDDEHTSNNSNRSRNNRAAATGGSRCLFSEVDCYVKAVEANPNYARAWENLASVLLEENEAEDDDTLQEDKEVLWLKRARSVEIGGKIYTKKDCLQEYQRCCKKK